MTNPKLLLPLAILLAQASALADGGAVQLQKQAGPFVITVFTAPAPLSAGPVDISVLLQNRNGLEPVMDASVSLILRSEASRAKIQAQPTRERAQNKLLYAAPVTLAESGKWQINVSILRNGERTEATGIIDVAPASQEPASYWSYIAVPPLTIVLFAIRERLIRRKAKA
jgi:hypothetical protein